MCVCVCVCVCKGVRTVSEVSMELKFSGLNWLSLEPFSAAGHQSLKPVLNTRV